MGKKKPKLRSDRIAGPRREWVDFEDHEEEDCTWRVDVTFLASAWTCIYGNGCQGNRAERAPELMHGCCTHGAFFTDKADLDHVVVAVEMHAFAGPPGIMAGDKVPAREFLAIAGCALGADQSAFPALRGEPRRKILADIEVMPPRRVQRRNADQILRQADQVVAADLHELGERAVEGGAADP